MRGRAVVPRNTRVAKKEKAKKGKEAEADAVTTDQLIGEILEHATKQPPGS